MKRLAILAGTVILCAAPVSIDLSPQNGPSLSIDRADARVGRPLTPVSVAGVHRRAYRRSYYYHNQHYDHRVYYHGHYYYR